jgi:hypothetical protein
MARVGRGSVRAVARDVALAFDLDSEVGGIALVLVVVLVLDLWDFGAEKRARSFFNYFISSR